MITVAELSERLGVSTATISNAITGKGRMRDEKRREIIQAATSLGYDFSKVDARRRKKSIAIITEQIGIGFSDRIINSICTAAEADDVAVSVHNINIFQKTDCLKPDHAIVTNTINRLLQEIGGTASGIAYVAQYPWDVTGIIPKQSMPFVYAYCNTRDKYPCVHYDDTQGAHLATSHLISQGKRRIAMISGPIDSIAMTKRLTGYQRALVDGGLTFDPKLMRIGNWSDTAGYTCMTELLRDEKDIDAVFCQSDNIAVGAMKAIQASGLRVPEDVSVVGFDDLFFTAFWEPPITTIRVPCEQIGQTVYSILTDEMNMHSHSGERVKLLCELIARKSG